MSEMKKLFNYLKDKGYDVKRKHDKKHQVDQIVVKGNKPWDALCQPGSYGYPEGLIEVAGAITQGRHTIGWLTASDVIGLLEVMEREENR